MNDLPEPHFGKDRYLGTAEYRDAYTATQMREYRNAALEEAIILNWTEIMREGALVTWGDAETLGDRVIEKLNALKGELK